MPLNHYEQSPTRPPRSGRRKMYSRTCSLARLIYPPGSLARRTHESVASWFCRPVRTSGDGPRGKRQRRWEARMLRTTHPGFEPRRTGPAPPDPSAGLTRRRRVVLRRLRLRRLVGGLRPRLLSRLRLRKRDRRRQSLFSAAGPKHAMLWCTLPGAELLAASHNRRFPTCSGPYGPAGLFRGPVRVRTALYAASCGGPELASLLAATGSAFPFHLNTPYRKEPTHGSPEPPPSVCDLSPGARSRDQTPRRHPRKRPATPRQPRIRLHLPKR